MIDSIYDQLNQWDKDDEFFVALINKLNPKTIADLGCGTGRLTLFLASEGFKITGIDPDPDAIKTAKHKDKKQLVEWIIGTSKELVDSTYELVMMTSNVSQVFTKDRDWIQTLQDIYNSFSPGGHILFDSRNPHQRAWEHWNQEESLKMIRNPETGKPLRVWHEFLEENDLLVKYRTVYQDENFQTKVEENNLQFRSKEQITKDLMNVGFTEIKVYGDWKFIDATDDAQSYIFTAQKN